jgi:hypothetical protein
MCCDSGPNVFRYHPPQTKSSNENQFVAEGHLLSSNRREYEKNNPSIEFTSYRRGITAQSFLVNKIHNNNFKALPHLNITQKKTEEKDFGKKQSNNMIPVLKLITKTKQIKLKKEIHKHHRKEKRKHRQKEESPSDVVNIETRDRKSRNHNKKHRPHKRAPDKVLTHRHAPPLEFFSKTKTTPDNNKNVSHNQAIDENKLNTITSTTEKQREDIKTESDKQHNNEVKIVAMDSQPIPDTFTATLQHFPQNNLLAFINNNSTSVPLASYNDTHQMTIIETALPPNNNNIHNIHNNNNNNIHNNNNDNKTNQTHDISKVYNTSVYICYFLPNY